MCVLVWCLCVRTFTISNLHLFGYQSFICELEVFSQRCLCTCTSINFRRLLTITSHLHLHCTSTQCRLAVYFVCLGIIHVHKLLYCACVFVICM